MTKVDKFLLKLWIVPTVIIGLTLLAMCSAHASWNDNAPVRFTSLPQPTNPVYYRIAQVNPDPFSVTTRPTSTAQVATQPTEQKSPNWLEIVWTVIGTIFTALFGKQVLAPAAPTNVGTTTPVVENNIRTMVDQALLQAIHSGAPAAALQTGIGFIPGVGPIGSKVFGLAEPQIRAMIEQHIAARIGDKATPLPPVVADVESLIETLLPKLKARLEVKPA